MSYLASFVMHGRNVRNCLHNYRQSGGTDDTDQDRTANFLHVQDDDQEQANHEDECRPARKGAVNTQLYRSPARADDASIEQANESNKQADAHRNSSLQFGGNCPKYGLAQPGKNQQSDRCALPENQSHCFGVAESHSTAQGECHHRV